MVQNIDKDGKPLNPGTNCNRIMERMEEDIGVGTVGLGCVVRFNEFIQHIRELASWGNMLVT